MKILIVEDEVKTREGLTMLIKTLCPDAAVSSAECGQEALRLCSERFFDLIFTDIKMPGMSGFQMLSQLDRKGRMIVIVSGHADFTYAQQAIRFSVLDYVLKPVSVAKIRKVLQTAYQKLDALKSGCLYQFLTSYEELSDEKRSYCWEKLDLRAVSGLLLMIPGESGDLARFRKRIRERACSLQMGTGLCILSATIRGRHYIVVSAKDQEELTEAKNELDKLMEKGDRLIDAGTAGDQEGLIRLYKASAQRHGGHKAENVSQTIRIVKEFIGQNLETNISLAMLAEVAYVHPAYLSVLFKKETEQNLTDYIAKQRINRAKELLADPHHKIYEVAAAVGYGDAKYFSNVFKNVTGMTPREWRMQIDGDG